jgi:hypothetical protein
MGNPSLISTQTGGRRKETTTNSLLVDVADKNGRNGRHNIKYIQLLINNKTISTTARKSDKYPASP